MGHLPPHTAKYVLTVVDYVDRTHRQRGRVADDSLRVTVECRPQHVVPSDESTPRDGDAVWIEIVELKFAVCVASDPPVVERVRTADEICGLDIGNWERLASSVRMRLDLRQVVEMSHR